MAFKMKGSPMQRNFGISPMKQDNESVQDNTRVQMGPIPTITEGATAALDSPSYGKNKFADAMFEKTYNKAAQYWDRSIMGKKNKDPKNREMFIDRQVLDDRDYENKYGTSSAANRYNKINYDLSSPS